MTYDSLNWSPAKCATIGAVIVAVVLAILIPIMVMVNHYNSTEVKRANACTAERGTYVDNHCTWSGQ